MNKKQSKIYHRNYFKKYYKIHKEELLEKHKNYYSKNRIKIIQHNAKYEVDYYRNRYNKDILFKLKTSLRIRLIKAIKQNVKSGSAIQDLGCSIESFKQYIQSKFYAEMNWNNYGTYWHIDHIIPLSSFDLTNRKQLLKAVHYKNLQPLTVEDHKTKTAKERN